MATSGVASVRHTVYNARLMSCYFVVCGVLFIWGGAVDRGRGWCAAAGWAWHALVVAAGRHTATSAGPPLQDDCCNVSISMLRLAAKQGWVV